MDKTNTRRPMVTWGLQGREPGDPLWWRVARWSFLAVVILLPNYLPMPLWPIVGTLIGILLVLQFDLHGLPIRAWDWLAQRARGVRMGKDYEPGWYGYRGRTVRGIVDTHGELWFPLHDLALPASTLRTVRRVCGAAEIRRFGMTAYLSARGLQRFLEVYRSEELQPMRIWLERVVIPAHRSYCARS